MLHLVTGGSGFLGNLVARRLLAQGEQVRVLDLWEDGARPAKIEFVAGDVRDRDAVKAALRGVEVVHHNAALVPLAKAGSDFWSVAVGGSRLVAHEAVRAGVRTFVHVSSSAVFGVPETCPVTSDTLPRPLDSYGRAKLAGEQAVREVCGGSGLRLIVLRPRTILGEGRLGIFQILFQWIAEQRRIYVLGDGSQRLQFVHAHDLIDAYFLLLDAGAAGVFNIGTPRFGTLREDLEQLVRHAGSASRVVGLPGTPAMAALRALDLLRLSPLAPWHYRTYHKSFHFDVAPLERLGWRPRYANAEMLCAAYDGFLANRRGVAGGSLHRRPVPQRLLGLLRRLS